MRELNKTMYILTPRIHWFITSDSGRTHPGENNQLTDPQIRYIFVYSFVHRHSPELALKSLSVTATPKTASLPNTSLLPKGEQSLWGVWRKSLPKLKLKNAELQLTFDLTKKRFSVETECFRAILACFHPFSEILGKQCNNSPRIDHIRQTASRLITKKGAPCRARLSGTFAPENLVDSQP